MKYLMSQEEFEQLIGRAPVPEGTVIPSFTVIYFTATWCGACRRLDMDLLQEELPEVNWLKCDIDQNSYTPGFCGIKSIPTFAVIINQKFTDMLTSSDTRTVFSWVKRHLDSVDAAPKSSKA
jgi:thioredoxin-like negative regulator of GroEL